MKTLKRMVGLIRRLFRGEDVVQVYQSKEGWDRQFAKGSWEFLMDNHPNTNFVAGTVLHLAQARDGNAPLRVLDIGCGNGALARLIAHSPGLVTYEGFDISAIAVEQARTAVPAALFSVGSAAEPPVDVAAFDVLVFHEVFYYMDPNVILPEYVRRAAPGTKVIISMLHSWRSPFIWKRVRAHIEPASRTKVIDQNRGHRFDILVGYLRP